MKPTPNIIFAMLAAASLVFVCPSFAGEIVGGVSDEAQIESAPGNLDFDPPCLFAQTLPLIVEQNPATNAYFIVGNGAVLDACSNFDVSGYSPPNFLAWNCIANNLDGTTPDLPEVIQFSTPVSNFSCTIGTGLDTGTAVIAALDAGFNVIDFDSVAVSPTMQLLQVSGNRNIKYIYVIGPCTLVMDDLQFN